MGEGCDSQRPMPASLHLRLHTPATLISVSLAVLVGCGESTPKRIDQLQGINGQSVCKLTNQVFETALEEHLVYGTESKAQIYSAALNSLLVTDGFIPSVTDAHQVSLQIFEESGSARVQNLHDCSDLALIQQTRNRVMQTMDIRGVSLDIQYGNQAVFVRFLHYALQHLDFFSSFLQPTMTGSYDFGITFDLVAADRYDIKSLNEWKVLAVRDHESPLKAGDHVIAVQGQRSSGTGMMVLPVSQISPQKQQISSLFETSLVERRNLKIKRIQTNREIELDIEIKGLPRYGYSRGAPLVTAELVGDLVYVALTEFEEGASQQVLGHLSQKLHEWEIKEKRRAQSQGKPPRSADESVAIILDLRFNPGGLIAEALKLVGLFLPQQVVGIAQYKESLMELPSIETGRVFKNPLAIMINHASASASELVGQVLQETGRAILAGERSFGKFIGQNSRDISLEGFGNFGRMVVTTFRFFGPKGQNPQAYGLDVDLKISQPSQWQSYRESYLKECKAKTRSCRFRMEDLKAIDPQRFIDSARELSQKFATATHPLIEKLSVLSDTSIAHRADGLPRIEIDEGTRDLSLVLNRYLDPE